MFSFTFFNPIKSRTFTRSIKSKMKLKNYILGQWIAGEGEGTVVFEGGTYSLSLATAQTF